MQVEWMQTRHARLVHAQISIAYQLGHAIRIAKLVVAIYDVREARQVNACKDATKVVAHSSVLPSPVRVHVVTAIAPRWLAMGKTAPKHARRAARTSFALQEDVSNLAMVETATFPVLINNPRAVYKTAKAAAKPSVCLVIATQLVVGVAVISAVQILKQKAVIKYVPMLKVLVTSTANPRSVKVTVCMEVVPR